MEVTIKDGKVIVHTGRITEREAWDPRQATPAG